MMKKVSLLLAVVLVLSAAEAFAAGLSIPEQGAAALGMSAAYAARSEDLSAIYYNPAGLDYVGNTELYLGLTPIKPVHSFEGDGVADDANGMTFFPPQVYLAHRLNKRVVIGMGVYAPYGLGTDWDESWNGRYTSTYGEIAAVYVTPAISYKITDMISVGGTFSWIWSEAKIEKMLDSGLVLAGQGLSVSPASTAYDSKFGLKGEGGGVSYTIGLMLRPADRVQLGLVYTGATEIEYEGDAKFNHSSMIVPGMDMTAGDLLQASFPNRQDGEAVLNLPSVITVGLKYDLTSKWDTEFDMNFVSWSEYDELVIDLEKDLPKDTLVQPKNWDDTMTFRLGTSYDFSNFTGRLGFMYDQAPVPDETFDGQLPDNDRFGGSIGFGFNVGKVTIDASYMYLKFSDRDKENLVGYSDVTGDQIIDDTDKQMLDTMAGGSYPVGTGTYESYVNLFSVAASFKF